MGPAEGALDPQGPGRGALADRPATAVGEPAAVIDRGAVGLLLSMGGIRVVQALAPAGTPRIDRLQVDSYVLWFTLGISLFSAILFGLLPALQASSNRVSAGPTRQRHVLRSALLIGEVGLAVILVVGGALLARSLDKLMRVDTGVRADHLLLMNVGLSDLVCKQGEREACRLAGETLLDRVQSLPGVDRAASAYADPFHGITSDKPLFVEGREVEPRYTVAERYVTSGYFATTGMRILAGRDFEATDVNSARPVAIVTESFVRKYIQGSPLGKRFIPRNDAQGRPVEMEIVGVVNDTRNRALAGTSTAFYTPMNGFATTLLVRTTADPAAMVSAVTRAIQTVDQKATIENVKTMDQLLYETAAEPRFQAVLLGSFSVLALVLAMVGIYGVTSYSVAQRTHEIGIRMALGARREDVLRLVVGQGTRVSAIGILLGWRARSP